jgi:hypothetical protein
MDDDAYDCKGCELIAQRDPPPFDVEAARELLGNWQPKTAGEFVMGNPAAREIRKRWPRADDKCQLCGAGHIRYASMEHYTMGDW